MFQAFLAFLFVFSSVSMGEPTGREKNLARCLGLLSFAGTTEFGSVLGLRKAEQDDRTQLIGQLMTAQWRDTATIQRIPALTTSLSAKSPLWVFDDLRNIPSSLQSLAAHALDQSPGEVSTSQVEALNNLEKRENRWRGQRLVGQLALLAFLSSIPIEINIFQRIPDMPFENQLAIMGSSAAAFGLSTVYMLFSTARRNAARRAIVQLVQGENLTPTKQEEILSDLSFEKLGVAEAYSGPGDDETPRRGVALFRAQLSPESVRQVVKTGTSVEFTHYLNENSSKPLFIYIARLWNWPNQYVSSIDYLWVVPAGE